LINYERLPMMDVVFDRMGRLLSTSLRNLTSDNVEASIDDITSVRFGDYLNSVPMPAMLSIIKAEEWDNQGLIVCDSSLIYSMVDVLLGGRKGAAALRIEGRPYTTIECNLMERVLHVTLNDMSAAFDPLSPVTFRFERLETNPRFAAITQPTNAAILIKIRIDMEGRGGMMEILLPFATLEPIRELLLQMFMGEKFGRDSIWEGHLTKELYKTDVEIDAILGEMPMSLREVMNWKVGSTIIMETKQDDLIELRCGQRPMFTGKMGRRDKNIAVRLEEEIVPTEDIV
jgi:flagellar motor switch protein FliM